MFEKELQVEDEDTLVDMRYKSENELRLYVNKGGIPFFLDVNVEDQVPKIEKCKKWEDKTIFKFGARFIK